MQDETTIPKTNDSTVVSIVTGPFVGPVLRRVVGMLAARADLPLDRLDDAVLVAEEIAMRAPGHVRDDAVRVRLDAGDRTLTLCVGPLNPGGAQAIVDDAAVPGVGNVISQLADAIENIVEDGDDYLQVQLTWPVAD